MSEEKIIWQMDNTDCLVPENFKHPLNSNPDIQNKKGYLCIADGYRLIECSDGDVRLESLLEGEWESDPWGSGLVVRYLVQQNREVTHRFNVSLDALTISREQVNQNICSVCCEAMNES